MNIEEKKSFAVSLATETNFDEFSALHEKAEGLHLELAEVLKKIQKFKFKIKISEPTETK